MCVCSLTLSPWCTPARTRSPPPHWNSQRALQQAEEGNISSHFEGSESSARRSLALGQS